jgi:hypothetical protein
MVDIVAEHKRGLTIKGIQYHFIDESNSVSQNAVFVQSCFVESDSPNLVAPYRASSKLNSANTIRQNGPRNHYSVK